MDGNTMLYIPREIEPKIKQFIEDREVLAITGPRQCGKTTLLNHIGEELSETHGTTVVHYISFEDELEKQKFKNDPRAFIEFYLRVENGKRHFFLFDEIQYVPDAGKILKLLFDVYPKAKFIVTGSATLDIVGLGRYLVGRVVLFSLYPFSFAEMLRAKDEKIFLEYRQNRFSVENPAVVTSVFLKQLSKYLQEYITFGGYPRIVLEPDPGKKSILLRNIFTTYIEKDVVTLFGNTYREKAVNVLRYLAEIVGQVVNFQDVSQAVSIYHKDLKYVLSILEQTYVVRSVKPFHKNVVTELKKNPKYYFVDFGLRNALLDRFRFTMTEQGGLFENYVFQVLKDRRLFFWRTTNKAEVDFVLADRTIPIEVKAQARITKSLLSFIKNYQPQIGVIASVGESFEEQRNGTRIFVVPLALL